MRIEIQILLTIVTSTSISGLIIFLSKTYITEKIKGSIKYEYDNKLESYKNELKSTVEKDLALYQKELDADEKIKNEKWLLKREACLEALEIADTILSNLIWEGIDNSKIVKEDADTIRFRKCYNNLACTCDNPLVFSIFKKAAGFSGKIPGDVMTDLRNAIRAELNFGDAVDVDRDQSFFGRIEGDKK